MGITYAKRRNSDSGFAEPIIKNVIPCPNYPMSSEVRVIVLERGAHKEASVHRIQKGWVVRFVRGTSLLGCEVSLSTSLEENGVLEWKDPLDHLSARAEVFCDRAGAFQYTFTVDGDEESSGSGYFLVFPTISARGKELPLDAIACQTHLVKLLGPIQEWESRLRVAHESGYNMVHLTPIHELGESESSYSISDHHALNTILCPNHSYTLNTFNDVATLINKLEHEWGMVFVQDVVWNHAAKNAKWLQEHPECAYNCENSPHLRPAYVVDRAYHHFGKEVSQGKWESRGVPVLVDNIHHVNNIEYVLRTEVLPKIRLYEFYQTNVEEQVSKFIELATKEKGCPSGDPLDEHLSLIEDPEWTRLGCTIDMKKALKIFNKSRSDATSESERIEKCAEALRTHLERENSQASKNAWEILLAGMKAVIGHITYERVAQDGPRYGPVTVKKPLLCDYFLHLESRTNSWQEEEKLAYDPQKNKHIMAFNGWVMSCDPLKNFALKDSQVYLRRELVCWGDSVKLNYGEKPEDCPFLWDYMKIYTEQCAKIFKGVRIDNAHGTPIHVAEYLLRAARKIRPDLYAFAELFTGSEYLDNIFVNRLGITSLIREAQSANDSHEQGRLVYRYGGDCVGAMKQKRVQLATDSIAHGMLLDQSHDNKSPIEERSVWDLLPTAAMVSMASCAAGSTRGYDELVRHAVHVVEEKRLYGRWEKEVTATSGIVHARKVLNNLHEQLARDGFNQVFVDQMSHDVVAVTRHNPVTHDTVVVVSHTVFNKHNVNTGRVHLKWIPIGGVLVDILFEMEMKQTANESDPEDKSSIVGLSNFHAEVREHVPFAEARQCAVHEGHIELTKLTSGSVIGFKIHLDASARKAVDFVNNLVDGKDSEFDKDLSATLAELTLQQFNTLLFCCEKEDQAKINLDAYEVPNFKDGKFNFNGLQGLIPVLAEIRLKNELGHAVCENLRQGCWLAEYIVNRVKKHGMTKVADIFSRALSVLSSIPHYLRPCYFEGLIQHLYNAIRNELIKKMHPSLHNCSSFVRSLVLSTVSFVGYVPGAGLAPLPSSMQFEDEHPSSLSAGLPHFSIEIWRNWGRDTFIALPGCLLATGRYTDARNIIISFAGSMRHGLIPNLLAEGKKGARFNCRDAVWFWLYAIVRYVREAPDGKSILTSPVRRIYPNDDTEYGNEEREEPLLITMLEALRCHYFGIHFRERNAGGQIDEHMNYGGFQVDAFMDHDTGFIKGGNEWNCGTWMDKMGSSEKAGNRGFPATPRDGCAVELQGLAYAVLCALEEWHVDGIIEEEGIQDGIRLYPWSFWANDILKNFEKHFFVAHDSEEKFVNRKGIVKDTVGSTQGYTDFQLRPNFTIALAVAPDLLDPLKAWEALNIAKEVLLGPIGIKTLDPADWAYNGFYNNSEDGEFRKTAKGWNYHQGPEWVWVAGFYLKARIAIGQKLGGDYWNEALKEVESRLGACQKHISSSSWRSLPELTQQDGGNCGDSCPAQAWSVSCILETCIDLNKAIQAQGQAE